MNTLPLGMILSCPHCGRKGWKMVHVHDNKFVVMCACGKRIK